MKFTAADLAEIRRAFRDRIAAAPRVRRSARPRVKRPVIPEPVTDPAYDDSDVITNRLVAAVFSVHPKTVARWADAGVLPFFRTLGGQRRFRWGEIRRVVA